MAELPDEWKLSDDGSPGPNWVAALHRSCRNHPFRVGRATPNGTSLKP